MKKEDLIKISTMAALNQNLDPALVCALIENESRFDPFAMRYEPAFLTNYIEPMKEVKTWGVCSLQTEKIARATSWGLMQIMGQVAREYGCDLEYLSALCEPLNGLRFGCMKLKRALDRWNGNVTQGLLAFNGAGNANYPDLVMNHYNDYAYLNSATRRA